MVLELTQGDKHNQQFFFNMECFDICCPYFMAFTTCSLISRKSLLRVREMFRFGLLETHEYIPQLWKAVTIYRHV